MSTTLSQITTFLKIYFGGLFLRVLALFDGARVEKFQAGVDIEAASHTASADDPIPSLAVDGVTDILRVDSDVDDAASGSDADLGPILDLYASTLFSALASAPLPSLPSVLLFPQARPPLADSSQLQRQIFGPASDDYYTIFQARPPLGTIINVTRLQVSKTTRKKTTKKSARSEKGSKNIETNKTEDTGAANTSIEVELTVSTLTSSQAASTPVPAVDSTPALATTTTTTVLSASSSSPTSADAPSGANAPGSPAWNAQKAALLGNLKSWNTQFKATQRRSLPSPAASPIRSPETPTAARKSKRHSAPPVLVTSTRAPRLDLNSLIFKAQETIAALDAEEATTIREDSSSINHHAKHSLADVKHLGSFSAVAVEEGRLRTNSREEKTSGRLISSISTSRSMDELENASSRSIGDLCGSYGKVMAGPTWRRLLALSDDISARRRNESVV